MMWIIVVVQRAIIPIASAEISKCPVYTTSVGVIVVIKRVVIIAVYVFCMVWVITGIVIRVVIGIITGIAINLPA